MRTYIPNQLKLSAKSLNRLVFDADSYSRTGIDAKDIEEQPQANLDVFGVYAVFRQCRDSHKKNRLSMLGVLSTWSMSGYIIFQVRHVDARRHMEYGSSWVRAVTA